ncbi:protein ImuB [Pontibaca methylaminivorans]|uniref:DNA-directed DNA polymerase n=1 Tax=Pontibaca methylaminivorans TaxID=515897 RepID=A0A1R3X8K4_9RHOB|nr:protein ImuB [Pontibaca methylaminivorans]
MLAGREGGRRVVTAADAAAKTLGLRVGMTIAQAQAQVPGLEIRPAEPDADRMSLGRLALWLLQRISPLVALDGTEAIVIDVTGAAHLHGGEAALLDGLVGRLAVSGITARAAIADTRGAAHALARFRADPVFIAPRGEVMAHIAPLPLAALRLPASLAAGLDTLGLMRIGDLAALPRAPLTRRFGPEPCRRLDQALGRVADPIEPVRINDLITARRRFAEPIAAPETIARYLGKLVTALCEALERRGLGARRLDLVCERTDGQAPALRVGLARPSRDAAHLARLLAAKIENIDPGFGIEAMELVASRAEPLAARQAATSLIDAPAPDLAGLVDRLMSRVGPARVYRLAGVASDVPERSVRRIAPLSDDTSTGWPDNWPRPARLLPHPEPIETMALLPDHPPAWFIWRGTRHMIARADGPERIFGEWWTRDAELAAVRDYFRVEDTSGARYWIFRAGDGEDAATGSQRWFLHGLFG